MLPRESSRSRPKFVRCRSPAVHDGHMWVCELYFPGNYVTGLDGKSAAALMALFMLMETGLAEGAVSLDFFEGVRSGTASAPDPYLIREESARDRQLERAVEMRLRRGLPSGLSGKERWDAETRIFEEAQQEVRRGKWQRGEWPKSYKHHVPFVYAKAFLYAIDSVAQALAIMAKEPWAPDAIRAIAADWESGFPTVRAVRNSSQHQEERALGRGPQNRPLAAKPVASGGILAPDGVMVLGNLNGNRFGCTMADGHFGEVEVSATTLGMAGAMVQRSIEAFTWVGSGRFVPT